MAIACILKGRPAMATAKEEIRRILDTLPNDASWEDIQYSIYVRERIERGRREADEGKIVDQEEIERRMKRWLAE
jgi:predicted transcriptional regulator